MQKVCDRLYEFFYNRYYYKVIKNIFDFPNFTSISIPEFEKVHKKAKKVDKELVKLVKKSKYDGDSTMIQPSIFRTEVTQPDSNVTDNGCWTQMNMGAGKTFEEIVADF